LKFSQITVRTKLAGLMLIAIILLAGTRGLGLIQLGGYLDRMTEYTTTLDLAHQQIEAAHGARIAALEAGQNDAAARAAHAAKVRELQSVLQARRGEAAVAQQRERSIMHWTYVSMLVLVFVICGAIFWLLMRLVVKPLQGMVHVAHRVAAGDLASEIAVNSGDEIGQVMQALNEMNLRLGELIGKIRGMAHSVGNSSAQIAGAGEQLSSHVEHQGEFLQRTGVTLRELAAAVVSNSESAQRARELAAQARDVAIKGNAEVTQAVDTMTRISANSKQIVDIVAIIDGIAFQTNILALNAAVEAARAGEQGRGFTVVAAEVRALAQRSAGAAKEIAALIKTSVHELQQGSGLVEKAGATMAKEALNKSPIAL